MKETAIVVCATICITICFVTAAFTMPGETALFMTLAGGLGAVIARYVPQAIKRLRK